MDELEISGKRYISTRRAAREHGYHSDYMGQLIRSGKVAGQKVGRAWYIDEQSLAAYFNKEQVIEPEVAPIEQAPVEVPAAAPQAEPEPEVVAEVVAVQVEEIVEPEIVEPVVEVRQAIVQDFFVPEAVEEKVVVKKITEPEEIFVEEKTAPAPMIGGLRYATDDSPVLPPVMRAPHAESVMQVEVVPVAHATRQKFPVISLTIVGVLAIAAAALASNFVSATVVSEPGKSAIVQYAIHW